MSEEQGILFVCPHGAAKSVIATVYCRQYAAEWNLPIVASSAGTEPEEIVPAPIVAALALEGGDVAGYRPRLLTREEFLAADRVITIGGDVGTLAALRADVERWDDVPLASQELDACRASIRRHVATLLDHMSRASQHTSSRELGGSE